MEVNTLFGAIISSKWVSNEGASQNSHKPNWLHPGLAYNAHTWAGPNFQGKQLGLTVCLSEEPAALWGGSQLAHFSWLPFSGQATRFNIVPHWDQSSPELIFSWVVLLPTHTLQLLPPSFSWQATRFNSENSQRLNWFPPPGVVDCSAPLCFSWKSPLLFSQSDRLKP